MIANRQKQYAVNTSRLGEYARKVRRALKLGARDFNVCLVDDGEIRRLNSLYRGLDRPTDVLSFSWVAEQEERRSQGADLGAAAEFRNFLGDIVISTETAGRNARREGHSTLEEIRLLILHGVLHLLGYDHERDRGEMTRRELVLRRRLGISGG